MKTIKRKILSAMVCVLLTIGLSHAATVPVALNEKSERETTKIDSTFNLSEFYQKHKDYQFTFLFPVNVYNAKIHLNVKIPKNFSLLYNKKNDEKKIQTMQFLAKNPTDPDFGSIITQTFQIGGSFKARNLLENIVAAMEKRMPTQTAKNDQVILKSANRDYGNYEEGSRLVLLGSGDKKHLIAIFAASGPYDSVLLQYGVRIKTDDQIAVATKKAEQFFKDNVQIVKAAH